MALYSLEAEETLLGLALIDLGCAEAAALLPQDVFWFPECQAIHKIVCDIIREHGEPNIISVHARAPEHELDIIKVCNAAVALTVSTVMYPQVERELMDLWKRRRLKAASEKVLQAAADMSVDVDELCGIMTTAANESAKQDEDVTMKQAALDFVDDLDPNKVTAIGSGIAGLDRITGGLQNGQLIILGARPKVGKTALALTIAANVARKHGPVLISSLEMSPKELFERMIANETNIDMQKIVTKKLESDDYVSLIEGCGPMSTWPIRFSKLKTPLAVRRKAAAMKRKGGLAMIMVDYLQLMRADGKTNSRYEAVSEISRELKLLAMDLDVPILALTQFNRESEQGGIKSKPTMAQARDSGSIEQDANVFLIQYAPSEPKAGSGLYEYWAACQRNGTELQMLEIAANRQGPTGTVPMQFDKKHMKFTTLRKENES